MKPISIVVLLFTVFTWQSCTQNKTNSLKQKEAQLDARIHQLKQDVTQMEATLKTKEAELEFIEKQLDSISEALLKRK